MSEVTVETIPAEADETPDNSVIVNEGETTVVVETPDETSDAPVDLALTVGQLVEKVTNLETKLNETVWAVEEAQITADVALEESAIAEETAEEVGEATVEVAEAVVNDDTTELEETATEVEDHSDSILPTKKHFVHRSFRELIGRG